MCFAHWLVRVRLWPFASLALVVPLPWPVRISCSFLMARPSSPCCAGIWPTADSACPPSAAAYAVASARTGGHLSPVCHVSGRPGPACRCAPLVALAVRRSSWPAGGAHPLLRFRWRSLSNSVVPSRPVAVSARCLARVFSVPVLPPLRSFRSYLISIPPVPATSLLRSPAAALPCTLYRLGPPTHTLPTGPRIF